MEWTVNPQVSGVDGQPYERRWWALLVLCLSLVVIGMDNTILNVALPTLARDLQATASELRWPSGDPIVVRVGVASGPAVAGVIGQRKFAYDLWGDTVNLASRLEASGEPGRILVSEAMAERLADRYEFGPPHVLEVKGKGPTPVRFLMARRSEVPAGTGSP